MYITKEYYRDVYKGVLVSDDDVLDRYISRASDKIDIVTNYKIVDLNLHPQFTQNAVMKATAAQVEFYAVQGGPEASGSVQSVKIGNFQYTDAEPESNKRDFSDVAMDYLKITGLLYKGLKVVHHV